MDHAVRVLSTLALKGAVHRLAGQFETISGGRIDADFAPTLALSDRLRRGESADVVILTREGLDELAREGRVVPDSCVDLARSYVGVAVKAGATHPDITTEPALRAALLGARSVAYSRIGASGILFAQLIGRLGIASEINARAKIIPQGFTAERLVTDEADLAVQQISELMQVGGIEVIGPIPHRCRRQRCFPPAEWRCRPRSIRRIGCCSFSLRRRSHRCCATAGWNLEFAGRSTQPAGHEGSILPACDRSLAGHGTGFCASERSERSCAVTSCSS